MSTKLETLSNSLFLTISEDHAAMLMGGQAAAGSGRILPTYKSGEGTSSGDDYVTD
jgi:hypothetical protein